MAIKTGVLQEYGQWALMRVASVVASTGEKVGQLVTGITSQDSVGWAIHRIEYLFPYSEMSAAKMLALSTVVLAISQSSSLTQPASPDNPAILDFAALGGREQSTAVGITNLVEMPIVHDLSANPILCLPQNLYLLLVWSTGANLGAVDFLARLWYRKVDLATQDYLDLLQLRLPLGVTV